MACRRLSKGNAVDLDIHLGYGALSYRALDTHLGYQAFAPLYAQGCDLSCIYSNVIVHARPQPWMHGYLQFSYHISVYMRHPPFTCVFFLILNAVKY